MRYAIAVIVAVLLIGAAFWGGTLYAGMTSRSPEDRVVAGAPGGGPFAQLTQEDRAKLESMSDEERQAFMQERFGAAAPAGGMRDPRGGVVEGEVLEVASETVTVKLADGGSQTLYTDADTVIGYAEGARGLAVGSEVLAVVEPEADGVVTAGALLVKAE